MMTSLAVIFVTILAIVGDIRILTAEQIVELDDIDPNMREELKNLEPNFVKLSEIIARKLGHELDHKRSVDTAKSLLLRAKLNCFGACLASHKSWVKTLETFVALKNTLEGCETESYEILMKNYIVMMETIDKSSGDISRVREVLDFYREKHFERCRDEYKKRFANQVKFRNDNYLDFVDRAFSRLTVANFILDDGEEEPIEKWQNFIRMPRPKFSLSKNAQQSLIRQVIERLKAGYTPYLNSNPKGTFNQYLFRPCKDYRRNLGAFLNEVRFDAIYHLESGAKIEYTDREVHRAVVNNRLCASLLDEQEQLYEPMTEAWYEILHEPRERQEYIKKFG